VKLDGLVQSLLAEEAAAQRGGHDPRDFMRPRSALKSGSVPDSLVLHGYARIDRPTGSSSCVQLTAAGAGECHPGVQANSSTRDERPEVGYPAGEAPASRGNDDSPEG
jgi:hypothetical protein